MVRKILGSLREVGIVGFADRATASAYRRLIRPLLPWRAVRYASIPVIYDCKGPDNWVPHRWLPAGSMTDIAEYENALVAALRDMVVPGDRVSIVGSGMGVTASLAAKQVGLGGRVHCYEGARECVEQTLQTAQRNGVADLVSVEHAIIGPAVSLWGQAPDQPSRSARELADCDVLELDCEGAEADILREMTIRPRVVIVETHGVYGAPTDLVTELLTQKGYSTTDYGVAESRFRDSCIKDDVRVIVGVREGVEPA